MSSYQDMLVEMLLKAHMVVLMFFSFHRAKKQKEAGKEYKIFVCNKCQQMIRVPRGKGKIEIRCPKCGNRFVKKS